MSDLVPVSKPAPVAVFVNPDAFSPRVEFFEIAAGSTVAAILTHAVRCEMLDLDAVRRVRLFADGVEASTVEVLDWSPAGGQVVNLIVEPQDPVTAVLSVMQAIAAMAPGWAVTAGHIVSNAAFYGLGVSGTAANFIAAGVTIGSTLGVGSLVSSLLNPKVDSVAGGDSFALTSQSNGYRLREPFPLVMGARRVGLDLAALPYTQTVGPDVFMHVVLAAHYGPCLVEDIRIGETPIGALPAGDVQLQPFTTPGPERVSALYPGQVIQQDLAAQFVNPLPGQFWSPWVTQTTAEDVERIEFDLVCAGGLMFTSDHGNIKRQGFPIQVEWSPAGANTWTPVPTRSERGFNAEVPPMGTFWLAELTRRAVRRSFGWNVPAAGRYDLRFRKGRLAMDDEQRSTDGVALTAVRSIRSDPPILDRDLAVVFMRIKSSGDMTGTLPPISAKVTPIAPSWNAEANAWSAPPHPYDPATWSPTSNAAALLRYLLGSYPAAAPVRLTAAQFDASLGQAAALIAANNWIGSSLLATAMSQQEAMAALEAVGRFRLFWNGARLCAVPDYAKPVARQVFNGRNVAGYRWQSAFAEPIHAVFVEFNNLDEDTRQDDLTVYMDGYSRTGGGGKLAAELIESLKLDFACTANRAYREGRAYLAKRTLQREAHEWNVGADGLVATLGDRVAFRHNAALVGQAEARVVARIMVGGLVSALRLDAPVSQAAGQAYALVSRRADQVLDLLLATTPGTSDVVTLAAPLPPAGAPEPGDLVAFGPDGAVVENLEIIDLEPQGDGYAIKARQYLGEALLAAETGPIPPLQTTLSARPAAPTPRIVGTYGSPDGAVVTFDVAPLRGAMLKAFGVRWRITAQPDQVDANAWQSLPRLAATERQAITPSVLAAASNRDQPTAVAVDVEIRSILSDGSASPPAYALAVPLVYTRPPEPRISAWTVTGTTFTGQDGDGVPGILIAGRIDDAESEAVLVRYREDGSTAWSYLPKAQNTGQAMKLEIRALNSAAVYDVEIAYVRREVVSETWLEFTGTTAGPLITPGDPVELPDGHVLLKEQAAGSGVLHLAANGFLKIWVRGAGGNGCWDETQKVFDDNGKPTGDYATQNGAGGGEGGEAFRKVAGVAGQALTWRVGAHGHEGPTGDSTAVSPAMGINMTGSAGGNGGLWIAGGGGAAAGGATNTPGRAGGIVGYWHGGDSDGDQTVAGLDGRTPGAGGAGAGGTGTAGLGRDGRVRIEFWNA